MAPEAAYLRYCNKALFALETGFIQRVAALSRHCVLLKPNQRVN